MPTFASQSGKRLHRLAKIAQLVEHDLAKVGVAGSSPVFRSNAKINPWSLLTIQADEFKSGWRNW